MFRLVDLQRAYPRPGWNAANQLKGRDKAPDVFDLGGAVASADTDRFAPHKVATFADVPDTLRDAAGTG